MRRIASMAQGYQICHCEERSDVAISQNPTGQQGSHRRNRNCLPEIATAPSGPRNDKSEAFAILTVACTDCKCVAGSGMPLPYNGVCDQRECLPEIATAPSGPRNDKSEAFAILTVACTDCKCVAGPGCPLPYNGGCDQRDCLPRDCTPRALPRASRSGRHGPFGASQ